MIRRSLKFVAFALTPLVALTVTAEAAVRVRYFFQNGRDVSYLIAPFGKFRRADDFEPQRRPADVAPAASAALAKSAAAARASHQQMVFAWAKPCEDRVVYSAALGRPMPRTWDENCFRGDRITRQKAAGEYRIFFVGGSTVEDAQSDEEMLTTYVKRALAERVHRPIAVVNAGRAGFDSQDVLNLYDSTIAAFAPDLVVYAEAWNEQPRDAAGTRSWFARWLRADADLTSMLRWRAHRALYYKSLLYTYVVEKYAFVESSRHESATWRAAHFWKIDVARLRRQFTSLVAHVRRNGGELLFVTQAIDWPRQWRDADTFDYAATDRLLDRLRADARYDYDVREISALNQRLAVAYSIDLCRQLHVRVIDLLDVVEALGARRRAELFIDLGHRSVDGNAMVGRLIGRELIAGIPQ